VDPKRYYSVMLCDGNTYNYGYIGTRATGSEPADYMVVGPDWKGETPPGIKKVFRSSTQFLVAGYRTQLFSADDIDNVKKVQAGYKAQMLSAYLNQPPPPPSPNIDFPKIDKELVKTNFFEYLDFAMQFSPALANETEIRAQLAHWRRARQDHELQRPSCGAKARNRSGLGDRKINEAVGNLGKEINGWRVASIPGDNAHYNGDWLKRAVAAQAGIYGNDAVEAMYPLARVDGHGQTLDGSKHDYRLTFPTDQQPPVNSFWSLPMYDGKTQLLIENPTNRYLINSADDPRDENERRFPDTVHPEQISGRR
jgi:hypothetical protein